jgi:hypothetical protein
MMTERHPPDRRSQGRPAERNSAPVVTVNLESELTALRDSAPYKRNDHASATTLPPPGADDRKAERAEPADTLWLAARTTTSANGRLLGRV